MKLWLHMENNCVFGDGKFELLRGIEQTGSLKASCAKMGISYRKAWDDINRMEELLETPLVTKSRGGNHGGGTTITDAAREFIEFYEGLKHQTQRCIDDTFTNILKG